MTLNPDQRYKVAVLTPFFLAISAAAYAYLEFSRDGITSPQIWVGVFLVALFSFGLLFFASATIYLWRFF